MATKRRETPSGGATTPRHEVTVERATGILMARLGIGAAAAAHRLRTAARYAQRPVEQIAADVIADLLRRRPPAPALPHVGPDLSGLYSDDPDGQRAFPVSA